MDKNTQKLVKSMRCKIPIEIEYQNWYSICIL